MQRRYCKDRRAPERAQFALSRPRADGGCPVGPAADAGVDGACKQKADANPRTVLTRAQTSDDQNNPACKRADKKLKALAGM